MVMTDPVMPVTPVRAWAEYSEWSVFADTGHRMFSADAYPRGKDGRKEQVAWGDEDLPSLVRHLEQFGPLRSLRVLFSTGHAVTITPYADEDVGTGALWKVGNWVQAGVQADTDADAVQRAIDAAVAWIGAQANAE